AVCMENPAVFDDSHRLLQEIAARGDIDGFRIDHIDGLYDPMDYLWRLQNEFMRVVTKKAFDDLQQNSVSLPEWNAVAPQILPAITPRFLKSAETTLDCAALQREERQRLPLFVVVEKILGADEPLPPEWPVQGTTGYEFLNLLNGLFLDSRGLL